MKFNIQKEIEPVLYHKNWLCQKCVFPVQSQPLQQQRFYQSQNQQNDRRN